MTHDEMLSQRQFNFYCRFGLNLIYLTVGVELDITKMNGKNVAVRVTPRWTTTRWMSSGWMGKIMLGFQFEVLLSQ